MKVYLAAPYALRDTLRADFMHRLAREGHVCTSTWLTEGKPITTGTVGNARDDSDAEANRHVEQDMDDVYNSDALVLFTWQTAASLDPRSVAHVNSGGRHVETGMALAWGKRVVVYGRVPENIFHRRSGVIVASTWRQVLAALETPSA